MIKKINSNRARLVRHKRVRTKIFGTKERPRLNVFRSKSNIYAQIIDDETETTLASVSSLEKDFAQSGGNKEGAKRAGQLIAERAKQKNINRVVFDRGGYIFHGRVEEVANGAREAGLEF
jgi:large subunit ribosomal protein L18